jgi:hypothetical protein
VAVYFVTDSLQHEQREDVETHHPRLLFMHITRAAAMLLCMVTEVQAYFRFDGATINDPKDVNEWNGDLSPGDRVTEQTFPIEHRPWEGHLFPL